MYALRLCGIIMVIRRCLSSFRFSSSRQESSMMVHRTFLTHDAGTQQDAAVPSSSPAYLSPNTTEVA